jgi:Na+/serine symporter
MNFNRTLDPFDLIQKSGIKYQFNKLFDYVNVKHGKLASVRLIVNCNKIFYQLRSYGFPEIFYTFILADIYLFFLRVNYVNNKFRNFYQKMKKMLPFRELRN